MKYYKLGLKIMLFALCLFLFINVFTALLNVACSIVNILAILGLIVLLWFVGYIYKKGSDRSKKQKQKQNKNV